MRSNYLFALGKIRTLEKLLPDATDLERMIDAENAKESLKVLYDTDYAKNLLKEDLAKVKPHEFQKALDEDFKQLKELLYSITSDQELLTLLFLKNDAHNLKIIVKEQKFSQELTEERSTFGNISYEQMASWYKGKGVEPLYQPMVDASREIADKTDNPSVIDTAIDLAYFTTATTIAKNLKNEFIQSFLTQEIDLLNMMVTARALRLNKEKKWLDGKLIKGGAIEPTRLALTTDLDELVKVISTTYIRAKSLLEEFGSSGNLALLEKGVENLLLDKLKETKLIAYGPELVFAYYFAKKNAIRNVRLIMTAKLNNINPEIIKQRVRKVWL